MHKCVATQGKREMAIRRKQKKTTGLRECVGVGEIGESSAVLALSLQRQPYLPAKPKDTRKK